ncbi:hypothetical protein THAOC_28304, partial [Thalassiosira oceanica]
MKAVAIPIMIPWRRFRSGPVIIANVAKRCLGGACFVREATYSSQLPYPKSKVEPLPVLGSGYLSRVHIYPTQVESVFQITRAADSDDDDDDDDDEGDIDRCRQAGLLFLEPFFGFGSPSRTAPPARAHPCPHPPPLASLALAPPRQLQPTPTATAGDATQTRPAAP